jgi:hypothetical protein
MRSVGTMWIGIRKHPKNRAYRLQNAKKTKNHEHIKTKQPIIFLF